MKTKNILFTLFIALLLSCSVFVFPFFSPNSLQVKAETATLKITDDNYYDYDIDDSLYSVLNIMASHLLNKNGNRQTEFDIDVFNPSAHSEDYYKEASIVGEEILEDLKNGELNLSTGTSAKYTTILKNPLKYKITDISGLDVLSLTNIKSLILDGNGIKEISTSNLTIDSLTKISISSNGLTTFNLSSNINKLSELNLSNNLIKKINISKLVANGGTGPIVNLSCNEIENLGDITLPNVNLSKLDLSFNKLINITKQEIDSLNNHLVTGKKANILIQGLVDLDKLKAGDFFYAYKSNNIDNFNIKFSYNEESSFYKAENNLIYKTSLSNSINDIEKIFIPAGKIKIQFFSDTNLILDNITFPNVEKNVLKKLSEVNAKSKYAIPLNVGYKSYVENKEVKSLKQGKDIKVVFDIANIDDIPNKEDVLNNAEIFYQLGSKKPEKSNFVEVTSNGSYSYNVYATFDNVQSGEVNIQITRQDFAGVTLGVVIIIFMVILGFSGFYIFRWFKNGAQVAPLTEKELFRLRKRNGTLTETNNDDYISSLDAPRHETRVSDQKYNDDIENDLNIQSNLNSFDEEIKPTIDFPNDIDSKD